MRFILETEAFPPDLYFVVKCLPYLWAPQKPGAWMWGRKHGSRESTIPRQVTATKLEVAMLGFLFYVVCKFFVLRHWLPPRALESSAKARHSTDVLRGPVWSVLALLPQWMTRWATQIDNVVHNSYFTNGRTVAQIGKIAPGSVKHRSPSRAQLHIPSLRLLTLPAHLSKIIIKRKGLPSMIPDSEKS